MLTIIRENTTELELKAEFPLALKIFLLYWACGFAGIPIFSVLVWVSPDTGTTSLACQRIEPTQIECKKSRSRYFGIISGSSESIAPVLQAEFKTKEILENDGDRMVRSWLSLRTYAGETKIIEDLYNQASGDISQAKKMEAIASQIQTFINSQSPSITLVLDSNLQQGIGFSLFLSILPSIAALVLYLSLRSQIVILDKTNNRYTHVVHTLLGTRIQEHHLSEIQKIEVREDDDHDGPKTATLVIKLRSGRVYKLNGTEDIPNAHAIAHRLRVFLY
ncbi:MAG: hypothetical protein MUE44_18980 [Oscillatoriaceae cyanobacterium Prado104]|jgi:hypothetical protein|nr:hypothetical protein [Oscillatoriaceae cyanobacterium Prado104]